MRVIGTGSLSDFGARYPSCKKWTDCWLADMRGLSSPFLAVILERYPTVQLEGKRILIFTFYAEGTKYFMKIQIAEETGVLTVKWIGTATEYLGKKSEANHGI